MSLYYLKDNGKRSFVPPTFCWELIDLETKAVTLASDVDFRSLGLTPDQEVSLRSTLLSQQMKVDGTLSLTNPSMGPAGGRVFQVNQLYGYQPDR